MNAYADPLLDPRLRPYLKDVQAWHGYIRFLGLPTLQDHPDTHLRELFVSPLLSQYSVSSDSPMATWPPGQSVLTTLQEVKRLVVLGDPGSGKSVLVDWLAWLLVSGVEERIPEWLRGCIPLPLVLREMELKGVNTFDGLLEAFLQRPVAEHLRGQKTLLLELLESGRVLVLADGLDEVGGGQRESLRDALWEGFEHYPNSFFLATSRVVGYEDCPVHSKATPLPSQSNHLVFRKRLTDDSNPNSIIFNYAFQFAEVRHVMPFDDERIRAFAVNWYRLRSLKLSADSDAGQFIKALFRDETTRRLARNPQLLTLMALVYRVRAHLPDGRALLYDLIAEAYLESIDKARNITTSAADAAPWREKRRWLARVGFEMQYRRAALTRPSAAKVETESVLKTESVSGGQGEKELLATRTEVLGWLAEAMQDSGYSANPGFVDSYLHWVARRSGLLLPRGEEQFAFVHLSFQEYFAALYLCEYLTDADWVLAQREGGGTKVNGAALVPPANGEKSEATDLTRPHPNPPPLGEGAIELNSTALGTEADGRVSAANLRAWAKDPRWQETLVFCFENFAFQPKDAKRLLGWLFGEHCQDFLTTIRPAENPPEAPSEAPRAELLAGILTNPHSGLKPMEREAIFDAVWAYMDQAERRFTVLFSCRDATVLNRLLAAEEWAGRFWQRLIKLNPTTLNLTQSAISNLSPLAQLINLQQLSLNQMKISDLSPLAQLPRLLALVLDQTTVKNLSPLAQLPNLQSLILNQTAVSDLSPLAQLHCLRILLLNQTAVSDLSPLAHLLSLRILQLQQTAVSDLSPLAQLPNLQTLVLDQTAVTDLSPLLLLPNLGILTLKGIQAPIPPALRQRKGLTIIGP